MEKKKLVILLACVTLLLGACNENDENPEVEYAPGEISLVINEHVSTSGVFDFVNEYNLSLAELDLSYVYSTLPDDSIPYIVSELQSKSYFPNFYEHQITTSFGNAPEDALVIFTVLKEMTVADQQDWLQTMDKLQLTDNGEVGSHLLVRVTPGTEQYWVDVFKNHPDVTFAMRNPEFMQECATGSSNLPSWLR